jgi:hypothetical protein
MESAGQLPIKRDSRTLVFYDCPCGGRGYALNPLLTHPRQSGLGSSLTDNFRVADNPGVDRQTHLKLLDFIEDLQR